jgi:DNA-binding transcriptional MerR regulator
MFDMFGLAKPAQPQPEQRKPASAATAKARAKVAAPAAPKVRKKTHAYKSISEVASELNVATHVLRFWESKFPQVQPLKQSGGRRFYRAEDVALLRHIQDLLYVQGYSVRGVQTYLDAQKKSDLKQQVQKHMLTKAQMIEALNEIRVELTGDSK